MLEKLIQQIADELKIITAAQKSAFSAATHEESRQEDRHDTRSVEASYLAAGTAKRIEELERAVKLLKNFRVKSFKNAPIAPGALVELLEGKERLFYFLLPVGGGTKISVDGKTVNVITAQSQLGEALFGRTAGEEIELVGKQTRTFEIAEVS